MTHPDLFQVGETVIGPLDFIGTVEESSTGYCLVYFAKAGVRQSLQVHQIAHLP